MLFDLAAHACKGLPCPNRLSTNKALVLRIYTVETVFFCWIGQQEETAENSTLSYSDSVLDQNLIRFWWPDKTKFSPFWKRNESNEFELESLDTQIVKGAATKIDQEYNEKMENLNSFFLVLWVSKLKGLELRLWVTMCSRFPEVVPLPVYDFVW